MKLGGRRAGRGRRPACRAPLTMMLTGLALAGLLVTAAPARAQDPAGFPQFLAGVRAEALSRGLSQGTVNRALANVRLVPRVLELDDAQPEFLSTFWQYLDRAISDQRIAEGRRQLARHARVLAAVEQRYGVQPRFLVSFWGLESGFGSFTGTFPVLDSLATLAYAGRRGDFFRSELFDALAIVDAGQASPGQLMGSWAGAMGQPQFMPSTYRRYAAAFDGGGHPDIWTNVADVFASSANYLSSIGWRGDQTWGREVTVPARFDYALADLSVELPLAEWQRLGVRRVDGGSLPSADFTASLILPMGHRGPAFLVYNNFRVIMRWNNSTLYALAVGHLADRLAGQGPFVGPRPDLGPPLRSAEVTEMQALLTARGFDTGTPDGRVGPRTRAAVRAFQAQTGQPADGYPTRELLVSLRRGGGTRSN